MQRFSVRLWLAVALLLSVGMMEAQHRYSLKECVNYALQNNQNLKISRFDEYIAKRQVDGLTGLGMPQISGSVNLQGNMLLPQFILALPGMPPSKITAGQKWQHTAGAQLSQLIFDGTFFLGLEAAKQFVKLAELNSERSRTEIMNQVASAYYTALIVEEKGRMLDLNLERLQNLLKETKAVYDNGLAEKNDLDRVQLSLNNLKIEKEKFERAKNLAVELLKFQMGMPVNETLTLTEKLPAIQPDKEDMAAYQNMDLSKRVEFKVLDQQAKLADYNRRRYLMSYYPSLYGFAFYQFNMQGNEVITFKETNTFSTSAAGIKLNIPIFDGLRTNASVQEQKINMDKIRVSRELMERGMQMELTSAIATLQDGRDTYKAQVENVALAKRIYDTAKLKYKEGVGSSLEVNNAEVAYKEAEQNLLNAQLEYLNAKLKIWQVRGELQEKLLN